MTSKTSKYIVVLVEPKYGGNIGAVARAMMNFDFPTLYLVNPCEFDTECYARAMHARSLLDNAKIFKSFKEAQKQLDYCIATSSITTTSEKKHLRKPITLHTLTQQLPQVTGTIGLIFGREDYGLYNAELAACDVMLHIPTSNSYLSLNLSHAVTIVLYELYTYQHDTTNPKRELGNIEKEKLHDYFSLLLDKINYPDHKKEKTKIMFRRIMGRAMPSTWEYHTLMGVFTKLLEKERKNKKK